MLLMGAVIMGAVVMGSSCDQHTGISTVKIKFYFACDVLMHSNYELKTFNIIET